MLILILDQVVVGLVILSYDSKGLLLQRSFKELCEAIVIGLVILEVDCKVPVDYIQEDLFKLIELFNFDEAASACEEVVRVEDIRVELLGHECRRQYQSEK